MLIEDEWRDPTSMEQAFQEAMRKNYHPEGNPPEEIDYSQLKVGTELKKRE